jgi:hypothetical protein
MDEKQKINIHNQNEARKSQTRMRKQKEENKFNKNAGKIEDKNERKKKANQIEEDCVRQANDDTIPSYKEHFHPQQCANHRKSNLDDDTNQL